MDLDTFKPTFLIQIEGQQLSADITQEITSFVFEDNEEELDVLELSVTDRNLQFVDDPLFQEGNEIVARFGYVGDLSPRKKAVIKDIDYDFPENGDPTIRIKAYDKGFKLAGKENQKVWQKPTPGILYSDIVEQLPFKRQLFDGVLMALTLCFLENPDKALRESARVLRGKGKLVLGIVPADSPWGKAYIRKGDEGHPVYAHAHFFTIKETVQLFEKMGFELRRGCSALFWAPDTPTQPSRRPRVETGIISEAGFVGLLFDVHHAGV